MSNQHLADLHNPMIWQRCGDFRSVLLKLTGAELDTGHGGKYGALNQKTNAVSGLKFFIRPEQIIIG